MIQNYLDIFIDLSLNEKALLFVFIFLFVLRFTYLFLFTGRVLFRKKSKIEEKHSNPLSLILTVRNEEEQLRKNIPKILSLENVDFELIIVDDFSQDNSYQILGLLKERYKRLTISTLNQETRFSTKLANNIAIKATKNNWVLGFPVTLSDVNSEWLKQISGETTDHINVIVAYSNVAASKSLYNYLYRIESFLQHTKSTAYILNRIAFIYSHENLAFRKEKYLEIRGYGKKINEPFANLELLINTFIRENTTTVLFNRESTIHKSEAVNRETYSDLLKKNIRIEKHLPFSKQVILAIDSLSSLLFMPLVLLVLVLLSDYWIVIGGMLLLKTTAHLFIIKTLQNRLNERKIFIPSLVYEIVAPYFKLFFRWQFNRRSRKNRW